MIKGVEIRELKVHKDHRGFLYEILRPEHVPKNFGQIYLSAAEPGEIKANHYHKRKKEWFLVVKGQCTLNFKDMQTGEKASIPLTGETPKMVYIPENIAHGFKNTGQETLMILAYISEPYNPENDDTFPVQLF